jgi:hypothetical protein
MHLTGYYLDLWLMSLMRRMLANQVVGTTSISNKFRWGFGLGGTRTLVGRLVLSPELGDGRAASAPAPGQKWRVRIQDQIQIILLRWNASWRFLPYY